MARSGEQAVGETGRMRLKPQERRDQVIEAATEIISRQGLWGFSVHQVAKELGLTEPAVIYHFKNKVGLLVAVLEHRDQLDLEYSAERMGVTYQDLYDGNVSLGLRQITETSMERNVQQPEIVRLYMILQGESLSKTHPAYEYYQERERRAVGRMTLAAARDGFENPEHEGRVAISMMDGLQTRWLRDLDHVDLVAEWREFADSRWGSR
ncbi:TetR/AcrR family transcriptional regulator [Bifidobacterium simiarum]|uniref:TetR family transcriptional regulator n=1 Tax=Bifidobacterium simiarum TaxID=2045441 RepID=A0A2M9HFF8_9BIFI|nr:TetR/AcrR family transcriptional regulator [Bifidobacterium simiarum]MBT1166502.1 TetR/AcrR family transcriptional regulator [Bifidobacterium simiarum]PJM75549.1 TetR family transcriptional regulator [Bifidobacterium simiarum]